MKAVRDNKVYTVDENSSKNYQNQGFDIYDDDGNLVAYGTGKMVGHEEFLAMKAELEELKENSASNSDDQDVIEILKQFANEHQIALGNANKVASIVKKIKEHEAAESGE